MAEHTYRLLGQHGPLLELVVQDEDVRHSWFSPSDDEVREACDDYGLDYLEVAKMIRQAEHQGYHILFIDLGKIPDYMRTAKGFTMSDLVLEAVSALEWAGRKKDADRIRNKHKEIKNG